MKLPQIMKIVAAGSVAGISKEMFYLEVLTLTQAAAYSIRQGIPFSVYGENLIILSQNLVIVLLFWVYSEKVGIFERIALFFGYGAYSFVLFSGD